VSSVICDHYNRNAHVTDAVRTLL